MTAVADGRRRRTTCGRRASIRAAAAGELAGGSRSGGGRDAVRYAAGTVSTPSFVIRPAHNPLAPLDLAGRRTTSASDREPRRPS